MPTEEEAEDVGTTGETEAEEVVVGFSGEDGEEEESLLQAVKLNAAAKQKTGKREKF